MPIIYISASHSPCCSDAERGPELQVPVLRLAAEDPGHGFREQTVAWTPETLGPANHGGLLAFWLLQRT